MCGAGHLLLSLEPCPLSALTGLSPVGLDTASSYSSFPCPGAPSTGVDTLAPWPHPRPLAEASCLPGAASLQACE